MVLRTPGLSGALIESAKVIDNDVYIAESAESDVKDPVVEEEQQAEDDDQSKLDDDEEFLINVLGQTF